MDIQFLRTKLYKTELWHSSNFECSKVCFHPLPSHHPPPRCE